MNVTWELRITDHSVWLRTFFLLPWTGQMDGWMDGQTDGWMSRQMDRETDINTPDVSSLSGLFPFFPSPIWAKDLPCDRCALNEHRTAWVSTEDRYGLEPCPVESPALAVLWRQGRLLTALSSLDIPHRSHHPFLLASASDSAVRSLCSSHVTIRIKCLAWHSDREGAQYLWASVHASSLHRPVLDLPPSLSLHLASDLGDTYRYCSSLGSANQQIILLGLWMFETLT